ncbi:MAG: 30S ribosomal protein S17 [Candidatus Margulisbacteria bacterium]|nr:30S ribosomal protein S17 [Candidatus Margulisiibacteriota bacterium]
MAEERNRRKVRTGIVVSDKMDKTAVVKLERRTQHAHYKKIINRFVKVKVHDEKNECKTGDMVSIMETKPLSKEKRWRLVKILERVS